MKAHMQAAASRQHPQALNALAIVAEEGQAGLQKDPSAALHLYKLASINGCADAKFQAALLEHELGGPALTVSS